MTRADQTPLNLKSLHDRVYWDDQDGVINKLRGNPELTLSQLTDEERLHLIKELDRRMAQLWDKVQFERQHQLVDYNKLDTPS